MTSISSDQPLFKQLSLSSEPKDDRKDSALATLYSVEEEDESSLTSFGAYIPGNEDQHKKAIGKATRQKVAGQVMLMTGCLCGLNFASQRLPLGVKYVVCLDNSKRVRLFWTLFSRIITSSESIVEALLKIENEVHTSAKDLFNYAVVPVDYEGVLTKIEKSPKFDAEINMLALLSQCKEKESWLSSDERFHQIKKLFQERRFIFKSINFFNKKTVSSLSLAMQKEKLTFDSIYLSNIKEVAELNGYLKDFIDTMDTLKPCVAKGTVLILASRKQLKDHLAQKVYLVKKYIPSEMFKPSAGLTLETTSLKKDVVVKYSINFIISKLDLIKEGDSLYQDAKELKALMEDMLECFSKMKLRDYVSHLRKALHIKDDITPLLQKIALSKSHVDKDLRFALAYFHLNICVPFK